MVIDPLDLWGSQIGKGGVYVSGLDLGIEATQFENPSGGSSHD